LQTAFNGLTDDLFGVGQAVERIFTVYMQVAFDHNIEILAHGAAGAMS